MSNKVMEKLKKKRNPAAGATGSLVARFRAIDRRLAELDTLIAAAYKDARKLPGFRDQGLGTFRVKILALQGLDSRTKLKGIR